MALPPGPDSLPEWRNVGAESAAPKSEEGPPSPEKLATAESIPASPKRSISPRQQHRRKSSTQFDGLPDGPQLFQPLITDDPAEREDAAGGLIEYLLESQEAFKANYLFCVRFAYEVPDAKLRQMFTNLLDTYKSQEKQALPPVNIRVSMFIPQASIPRIDSPELASQFEEIFLQTGRVSHIDRVCAFHPSYLEKAYATYAILIQGPGPLPRTERLYLGILSAARFECRHFVDMLESEFLQAGGDSSWLAGHAAASSKHFEQLLKPSAAGASWSVAELVHAALIMATARSIASTVLGCGICPEVDSLSLREKIDARYQRSNSPSCSIKIDDSSPPEPDFAEETEKLQELLRSEAFKDDGEDFDAAARLQEFERIAQETETPPTFDFHDTSLSRYNDYSSLRHADFEVKGNKLLLVQDFSWAEQGFAMVTRYYPAMATELDNQFREIYDLTYHKFNSNENIDTLPFRRGLWYYVQRVKGVFFDDYNYQEVNLVLHRNTKAFIKKVSCYPSTINLRDFNNLGVKLESSEKVHICLLASEAAKQAELLWALDAVTQASKK